MYLSRDGRCSFDGCDSPIKAKRLCNAHYLQERKHGSLTPARKAFDSLADRIESNSTRTESGCRVWAGHIGPDGYARTKFEGVTRLVHRLAYQDEYGDIEDHETVNHLCGNRACSEPSHLVGASKLENSQYLTVGVEARGVSFHHPSGKWRARATIKYTQYHLGLHETPEAAAEAVREFRRSSPELSEVAKWEEEYDRD